MVKVKADLHNHLRTSSRFFDSDFNRAIDTSRDKLGKGGIMGLVNFNDHRYEDFISLRSYHRDYIGSNSNAVYFPDKDILVVKGQEVPTKQGHLLVLGLGKGVHLKQDKDLVYTLQEAEDNQGIIIADHPFYAHGVGNYLAENPDLLKYFDALEVHNGEAAFGIPKTPFIYGANQKALRFYNEHRGDFSNLGALSSSDGHSFYELGTSWTEIDFPDLYNANFNNSLRRSIRNTNESKKMKTNSFIGAVDHLTDLAFILKVAPIIGMSSRFEVKN